MVNQVIHFIIYFFLKFRDTYRFVKKIKIWDDSLLQKVFIEKRAFILAEQARLDKRSQLNIPDWDDERDSNIKVYELLKKHPNITVSVFEHDIDFIWVNDPKEKKIWL